MSATTKERILDAAEVQFAEKGYHGASLRAVTEAAGVNLAAVNYHLGSKAGLFQAVFARRIGPINRERLRLLDELEAGRPAALGSVDELLRCFLKPALDLCGDPAHAAFVQLIGRLPSLPPEQLALLRGLFADVEERFLPAFRRSLPDVPEDVFYWRFSFILGALCGVLADPQRIRFISGGRCDPSQVSVLEDQIVAFCAAGLRARSPANPFPREELR